MVPTEDQKSQKSPREGGLQTMQAYLPESLLRRGSRRLGSRCGWSLGGRCGWSLCGWRGCWSRRKRIRCGQGRVIRYGRRGGRSAPIEGEHEKNAKHHDEGRDNKDR